MSELSVQQTKLLNNYLKDNPDISRSKAIEILFGSSKGKADGKGITLERTQFENSELNAMADEFYSIADDNSGSTTFNKMKEFLNTKITPDNIVGFLDAYEDAKRGDNSIIDTVMSEFTLFSNKPRNEVLTLINDKLCKAAEQAGVSDEDIAYARDAFNSNLGDTVEMEKAVKFLLGAIKSKQTVANTPEISIPDAMSEFSTMYSDTTNVATEIFEEARNEEGSIAKGADTVLGWFGCTTAEDMREKLGADAEAAEKLTQAAEAVRKNPQDKAAMKAFNDAYKETFGIEFDANKIAAREAAWTTYAAAESLATTAKNLKATFFDRPVPKEYINFSQRIRQVTGLSNEELDAVIESYSTNFNMPAQTDEDKRQILKQYVQDLGKNITEQYNTVTQGKSLEQLKRDAELLDKSAFGTKDIVRDVIQYNENQAITAMVTEGGLEIAGTVALQFVPGLGQAASARLAASAAKWGNRGVKVANYLNKAEKGFAAAQKFQQGTKFTSTVANRTAQVVSQSAAAGAATATLGVIDGKDAEDIMRRTLMNMSFAGAGATSSVLAPKLMQSFGITDSALANEIAEEIINTAASYGITTLSGSDYTEADGFIDFATGLVMSRISHVKGGHKAGAAVPLRDNPGSIIKETRNSEVIGTAKNENELSMSVLALGAKEQKVEGITENMALRPDAPETIQEQIKIYMDEGTPAALEPKGQTVPEQTAHSAPETVKVDSEVETPSRAKPMLDDVTFAKMKDELAETLKVNDNLNPTAIDYVLSVITKDNISLAQELCSNKDFPKRLAVDILSCTNKDNIELSKLLCDNYKKIYYADRSIPAILRVTGKNVEYAKSQLSDPKNDLSKYDVINNICLNIEIQNNQQHLVKAGFTKEEIVAFRYYITEDNIDFARELCNKSDSLENIGSILANTNKDNIDLARELCNKSDSLENIGSILANTNKDNIDFARELCNSLENIGSILANTNKDNIDLARELCNNKNFPKEYIIGTLNSTNQGNIKYSVELELRNQLFNYGLSQVEINNILGYITKYNIEFTKELLNHTDIPKEHIMYILANTNKDNLDLARKCYIDRNFSSDNVNPKNSLTSLYPTPNSDPLLIEVESPSSSITAQKMENSEQVKQYLESKKLSEHEISSLLQLFNAHPKRFNRIANSGLFDLIEKGYIIGDKREQLFNDSSGINENTTFSNRTLAEIKMVKDQLEAGVTNPSLVKNIPKNVGMDWISSYIKPGEVYEQNNVLYIREDADTFTPLKLSKENFNKIFPPLATVFKQGHIGDCWLISSIDNLMDHPKGRAAIFKMFEQQGNDIFVKFENASKSLCFDNGTVLDLNGNNLSGANGIQMLEQAYMVHRYDHYDATSTDTIRMSELVDPDKMIEELNGGTILDACNNILNIKSGLQISEKSIAEDIITNYTDNVNNVIGISFKKPLMGVSSEIQEKFHFYGGHAYAVKSYDARTKMLYITNPWNTSTIIELPLDLALEHLLRIDFISIE